MLVCLLKANIALSLFYIAYYFGLRRLTFYTLNRFFLLTGIVCAAVCPFVDPSMFVQKHEVLNVVATNYAPNLALLNRQPATPLINIILAYIFWAGVTIMSLRLLIQLFSLWNLHRHTRSADITGNKVRLTDKRLTPFSFLQNIYINPSLHSGAEMEAIMLHESIHVKQWHTIDVLLGELNKVFYWFNPGAWLMSTAIRENLEYITDRTMLQQGIDAKAYQYSLIKVSGIPYATAIANNFNFSHLKNRIMMMNKKKSSAYHLLRYVVLGIIVVLSLLSMNFTRAAINKTHAVTGKSPAVVNKPRTAANTSHTTVIKHKPATSKDTTSPGVVVLGYNPTSKQSTTLKDTSGITPGYIGPKGIPAGTPIYFLDDQYVGVAPNIPSAEIESISVFKGPEAEKEYGPSGKNGVIKIYSKLYKATGKPAGDYFPLFTKDPHNKQSPKKFLWVIDGKKQETEPDYLKRGDVASMSVFKDDAATTALYDKDKQADYIVVIQTKKAADASK